MSTYHVYSNAKSDYEAIPEGISIAAVFLGGFWALAKRLTNVGVALVAVDALAVYAMRTGQQTHAPTWVIGGLVAMLAGRVFIAMRGADLREDSMPRRGYQFVATVNAVDPDTAIRRAVREELTESERGPGATGSMPRVAAAPSAFVQDRPGTRSEFDIEALRGGEPEPTATPDLEGEAAEAGAGTPDRPQWTPRAPSAGREDRAEDLAGDDDADPEERRRRWRLAAIAVVALAILAGAGYAAWYFLLRTPSTPVNGEDGEMAAIEASPDTDAEAAPEESVNTGGMETAAAPTSAAGVSPGAAATSPVASVPDTAAAGASPAPSANDAPGTATDAAPAPKPRPLSPAEIEAAWSRHYKPAPKCVEPADWDTYVECINTMMRQHDAFVSKHSQQPAETDSQAGKRP